MPSLTTSIRLERGRGERVNKDGGESVNLVKDMHYDCDCEVLVDLGLEIIVARSIQRSKRALRLAVIGTFPNLKRNF
jgi:hypothetical protein